MCVASWHVCTANAHDMESSLVLRSCLIKDPSGLSCSSAAHVARGAKRNHCAHLRASVRPFATTFSSCVSCLVSSRTLTPLLSLRRGLVKPIPAAALVPSIPIPLDGLADGHTAITLLTRSSLRASGIRGRMSAYQEDAGDEILEARRRSLSSVRELGIGVRCGGWVGGVGFQATSG